ncbi:hypothetical protein ACF09Z_32850 [Streptomyces erythrochromogenes]|uniref:hypothetical protein n=1 Tax=Streptomyces erythrochromogenes TaxID=285574 RepID=UPI0036F5659C
MLFFYSQDTGAAGSGRLDGSGDFVNLKDFPAGQFGDWTHIVPTHRRLFFYNRQTRAAASGELDDSGDFINLVDFPAGQFGNWTHIGATQDGLP